MAVQIPVYLDNAATTRVDPRVAEKMIPYLTEIYGNPASSSHAFGWVAEEAVETARGHIADLLHADSKEIIFTSGASESDNLAIKGAAHFYQSKGKHLITVKTEHKAVLDTMRELEREGFEVTYLDVQENGLIDLNVLKAALRDDTILVSVMWVNNEIGVIQDIDAIGEICRERGIVFHVDAAQAAGKVEIDLPLSHLCHAKRPVLRATGSHREAKDKQLRHWQRRAKCASPQSHNHRLLRFPPLQQGWLLAPSKTTKSKSGSCLHLLALQQKLHHQVAHFGKHVHAQHGRTAQGTTCGDEWRDLWRGNHIANKHSGL